MRIQTLWSATTLLCLIAGACSDRDLPIGPESTPANLQIVSGNEQAAPAGTELPEPIVARVTNAAGAPLKDQVVHFRVTSGDGTVSSESARTNEEGLAEGRWTLGPATEDGQALTVATAGDGGEIAATVTASALDEAAGASAALSSTVAAALKSECAAPKSGWIWCDDFEQNRIGNYFEYDNAGGNFARRSGVGVASSYAMRAHFNAGQVSAGSLKLAFGRTPDAYIDPVGAGTARYRDVYWRFFLRNASTWTGGGGDKLSRAIVFANANWAEAAVAHSWSGNSSSSRNYLLIESASGTDASGNLRTRTYNDFERMRWIGSAQGTTPLFSSSNVGQWFCVETRMRLNDAGQSNGVFEYWIDGKQQARVTNLNWVGSYSTYGINALFLENYWNAGSPTAQDRYIDNLVVSTTRIGCGTSSGGGTTPTVATVALSPTSASLAVGGTRQFAASARDASGNVISGKTFSWSSTNTSVATVSSSGLVTARAAGSTTIRATVDGKTGSATVAVQAAPAAASVTLSPTSASVAVGATRQFTATARDANGNAISGKTFTWSSTNTSVATVSSSGLVTARAAGSATIRATVDGKTGSGPVVVPAPAPTVATVAVSPTSASVSVGATRQLSATARDASGNTISGKTFTWSSTNTAVATVSSSGLVTARAAGSATIRATVDGRTGSSTITVPTSGGGGSTGARLVEDFSTYTSTSSMMSDPRGIYLRSEDVGTGSMALDTNVGYGSSTRSMRYTHTTGQTISRSLNLMTIGAGTDLWTEIVVRFSPGWTVGAAYKLLHINANMSNGARFGLNFEGGNSGSLNAEAPAANYDSGHLPTVASSAILDGNWHTIRYHTRIDGSQVFHEVWVDGQYRGSRGPLSARSGGLDYNLMSLGANMNESNGKTQYLWWGKVSVWTSNPGW